MSVRVSNVFKHTLVRYYYSHTASYLHSSIVQVVPVAGPALAEGI